MALDDRPIRTERLMERDLTDELLLYDAEGSRVHVLNATVRDIYLRCDGRHTVAQLAGALVAEYDVDEATARADTLAVLRQLIELGLVALPGRSGV